MSLSQVEICNSSLSRLGQSIFIASLDENSNAARLCRMFYDHARDRVLSAIHWTFASKTVDLQDIGTPPERWLYRFRLPIDCVKVNYLSGLVETTEDFEIISDEANDAKAICCNIPSPQIIYTSRVVSTNLFSTLFTDALILAIAVDLAPPLAISADIMGRVISAYSAKLVEASAEDMNQRKKVDTTECSYITARA